MAQAIVFDTFAGRLEDLDGIELSVALFDDTYTPAASDGDIDSLTGETAATRQTFDGEWDSANLTLDVAAADQWPVFTDATGETVRWAVVCVSEAGHADLDKVVSAIRYTDHTAAAEWTFQPANGIGKVSDGNTFETRLAAVEANTVAGVSVSSGDYPAASLATALAGYFVSDQAFLDEDDMASDSAVSVPSQQSVKAYVDSRARTFIYNSSGSQAGFRYNTWSDLMTAVGAADQPAAILFEQDESIPTTGMPTDGWDLSGAKLTSDDTGIPADRPIVTFPDGCKLDPDGLGLVLADTVTLRSDSTSPVITLDSTGIQVVNLGDLVMMMATAEVFIYCNNAGGVFIVSLGSVSSLRTITSYNSATGASETGSDHPVIGFNAGALNLVTTTHASAYIEAETVEGAANVTFSHNHAWPDSYETKITAASQTGISGSVLYDKKPGATSMVFAQTTTGDWTVSDGSSVADTLDEVGSRLSDVEDPATIAYTPNNGTHWADPDPTNVQDALDRIAAQVYANGSSTAIP